MTFTASILPTLTMSRNYLSVRRDLTNDAFASWLRSLPWDSRQRARIDMVLNKYYIGHSKDDKTIYWQIDENHEIRNGRMEDFKNGTTSWISDTLQTAGIYNPAKYRVVPTLFGMHLLDNHPSSTVNIVENEQDAILGAIYYGNFNDDIWMALVDDSMLNKEVLSPIIKRSRNMFFYTCHNNFEKWTMQIEELGTKHAYLMTNFVNAHAPSPNSTVRHICLEMLTKKRDTIPTADDIIREMAQRNPELNTLIEKLQLTPKDNAEEK